MIFVSFIYKNEIQVNFGVQRREADGMHGFCAIRQEAAFFRLPLGERCARRKAFFRLPHRGRLGYPRFYTSMMTGRIIGLRCVF